MGRKKVASVLLRERQYAAWNRQCRGGRGGADGGPAAVVWVWYLQLRRLGRRDGAVRPDGSVAAGSAALPAEGRGQGWRLLDPSESCVADRFLRPRHGETGTVLARLATFGTPIGPACSADRPTRGSDRLENASLQPVLSG